ncbi:SIMPL domain-containing protein [Oceanobacillus sojae]|uniref:SIMPL domain-containing protein n=1 Tax=Oceanobacillus sojae TaxID=582851 RepID=UPI0021A82E65|nr:SIMPL domain-containing protein [Oceanobacillus sojae]MCT1903100.1 SIMPL domain-containing protein [Oceanobacillus sojae]
MYYTYGPPNYGYRMPERQNNQEPGTITVTGSGTVIVSPSIARIQLVVSTSNISLQEAQEENARRMNQVLEVLQQTGIPREQIQTTSFSARPVYSYQDGNQTLQGYEVRNEITVITEDMDRIGEVIDRVTENGVNEVASIEFSVDNPENFYNEALSFALSDAKRKAEGLAEQLGANLNPVPLRINEQTSSPGVGPAQVFKIVATPIEPGNQSVEARLEVVYQI